MLSVVYIGLPSLLIDSAILDYIDDDNIAQPRHIFRLAAMAEAPISVADATRSRELPTEDALQHLNGK